jgi:hypothetical protein
MVLFASPPYQPRLLLLDAPKEILMSRQTLVLLLKFVFPFPCCFLPREDRAQLRRLALLGPGTQQPHCRQQWSREGNATIVFPACQLVGRGGS